MSVAVCYSHFRCDPHVNMAFDEQLLARALDLPGSTFLRLYTWHPGTITFGFNQRQDTALDWTRVGRTPVIRRVTGGRAIFHDESELTYSIVVNSCGHTSSKLVGSISTVSAAVADALALFLESIGVRATYERQSAPENALPAFFHKAPCFSSFAKYELVSGGRKVIASAQKRLSDAMLQHGSIKLYGLIEHPALDPDVDNITDIAPLLSQNLFGQQAEQFRLVMGQALGVDFAPATDDGLLDPSLSQRISIVAAQPVGRREIVKQTPPASSL